MFPIKGLLVSALAAFLLLIVYMELRLKFRKKSKPAMTESIVGSMLILTALGAFGSIFSGWAKVAAVFALPVFLLVGVLVGILYRSTDQNDGEAGNGTPNQAL